MAVTATGDDTRGLTDLTLELRDGRRVRARATHEQDGQARFIVQIARAAALLDGAGRRRPKKSGWKGPKKRSWRSRARRLQRFTMHGGRRIRYHAAVERARMRRALALAQASYAGRLRLEAQAPERESAATRREVLLDDARDGAAAPIEETLVVHAPATSSVSWPELAGSRIVEAVSSGYTFIGEQTSLRIAFSDGREVRCRQCRGSRRSRRSPSRSATRMLRRPRRRPREQYEPDDCGRAMKAVILAGGLGTRLTEETDSGRSRWSRSAAGRSCGTS